MMNRSEAIQNAAVISTVIWGTSLVIHSPETMSSDLTYVNNKCEKDGTELKLKTYLLLLH